MWLTMSGASVYLDDSDKLLNHLLSVSPALEYCPEHSRHSVNIRWTNFKWFSCYFPNLVCLGYAGPLLLNIKCKLLDFLVPIRTPGRTAVVNEQLLSARPVLSTMWISCQCFTKCGSRPRALSMIRCLLKVLNMSNTELLNLPQNLLFQFPPYPMHRQSPWQLPPSFALLLLLLPLENSSLLVILRNQPLFRSPLHFSPVTKQVCCPHCYYFHHIYVPWFDFMNMSKGKLSTFFFNVLFFSMAIILIITWVVSFEVTFV